MPQPLAPDVVAYVRPVYITLYLQWAALWVLVAWHYGLAAYGSWRQAGGTWGRAVQDITAPFTWAVRDQLCRLRVMRGAAFCGTEIPSPYYRGNLLRFAIFIGSLSPIMFGFYFFSYAPSRMVWPDTYVAVASVAVSNLAALLHLFLVYKAKPAAWRSVVLITLSWMLLAPLVLGMAGVR